MEFDDALEIVLKDGRSHCVPILYIIEVLMMCEDLNLLKTNV